MEAGDLVRRSARWLERRTEALRAAGGVVGTVGYEEVLERLKRALPERGVVVRHDATGVLVGGANRACDRAAASDTRWENHTVSST